MADNHARTFDFLAQNCPLEEPHALLLIDAHSDASRLGSSDEIREGLRRVISRAERRQRIEGWLRKGSVQAYNWIEPLMPRPIDHVWWVPGSNPTADEIGALQLEAREQLDANLDHRSRTTGAMAERFRVIDLTQLSEVNLEGVPVIASIDLDYFAGQSADNLSGAFTTLWEAVLAIPDLRYITFAISRPWLNDDSEAHQLLEVALRAAFTIDNASIQFEPFAAEGPDGSEKAKSLLREGRLPPRYEVESAPSTLRNLLLEKRASLKVQHETERFNSLLDRWRIGQPEFKIVLDGRVSSADGIIRVTTDTQAPLRVKAPPGFAIERVRWLAAEPENDVYNVLPGLMSGKAFTGEAASGFVRRKERQIQEILDDDQWGAPEWKQLADTKTGWGEIRLRAEADWTEIATGKTGVTATPLVRLQLAPVGVGEFRTALAEQFNVPYVFGAGYFSRGNLTGPEAGDGNDCANFLIAAMRRIGRPVPWGNPAQLRPWLKELKRNVCPADFAAIPSGSLETGFIVHFGNHATALWEDLPPLGKLDANDVLAHHLGGRPELISFGELYKRYDRPVDLYLAPDPSKDAALTIAIGGDMIFGAKAPRLSNDLRDLFLSADLAIANLEGCPVTTAHGEVWAMTDDGFSFTPGVDQVLSTVGELGVEVVSLANNHALDAGEEELAAGMSALQEGGLAVVGAGTDVESATTPVIFTCNDLRIGFFAVSLVAMEAQAEDRRVTIATLPVHSEQIAAQLRMASKELDTVIVLTHWGDEYTAVVNDEQRQWARWLVDQGASAVVGSHSHYPQGKDSWKGRPIWYSLGNLFAPNSGPNEGFRRRQVLKLSVDANGRILGGQCKEAQRSPLR